MKPFLLTVILMAMMLYPPASSQEFKYIPLNVDYATFHSDSGKGYVEFYVSFLQNTLTYTQTDSGYLADFSLQCQVKQNGEITWKHSGDFQNFLTPNEDIKAFKELRQILVCELPPGKYNSSVSITDGISGRKGEYLFDMTVPDYTTPALALSDIQLSVKISRSGKKSLFNKNGYRVIPNPSGMFTITLPVLYFYAEVYHLLYDPAHPGKYLLESFITNKEGEIVKSFPSKVHQKPGESAVLVGGNNIVTLSSDTYFFNLRLTDQESGQTVQKTKRFNFFKPSKEQLAYSKQAQASSSQLMLSYYLDRSEDELDEEFEKAKYIATKEEKQVYKTLNFKGKADFLVEFWKRRDPDQTTPENEFKLKYFQFVDYADKSFSTKFRKGWQTDRGRVLLLYGTPDEIERHPSQQDAKPYEIWYYNNLEGGSIFVFGDLQGFGNYELLHSTYSQELSQPDWERLVLRRKRADNPGF